MVYERNPDWLSLVSVSLYAQDGSLLDLARVTESLRGWQTDEVDRALAPGELRYGLTSAEPMVRLTSSLLVSALAAAGRYAAAGVIGTEAYELIKRMTTGG